LDIISRVDWSNFRNVDGSVAIAAVNRYLPPLASLLLVVLIGWQVSTMIWALVPGTAAGVAVPLPASVPISGTLSSARSDVTTIAESHLFGVADLEPSTFVAVVEADADLAETRLVNLVLKGTVASQQAEFSVALIADGTNEQKVYAIGDSVGSGATLHAIYADRVVLNEKGRLTNLKLPREFTAAQTSNVRRATTRTRQATPNSQSIQAVVSKNLTKLSDVIRPTPYLVNGQPAGYRVYPGRNRKQFAALGLRPGDIIQDIDGQALTDPTQAMQIFQSLGTAEQVTVTVQRNGQPQTIVLNTSQLDLGETQTK
jgi:general secretion pathway protein C